MKVADLMPASSPASASFSSTFMPRRSAQRISMRSSISAQSCESVPPAPAFTVTTRVARVVLAREQPRLLELGEPRLDRRALLLELGRDRLVLLGQLLERLEVVDVGLERAERLEPALRRDACSADTVAARSWSSQKPGACISPSSAASARLQRELGQR